MAEENVIIIEEEDKKDNKKIYIIIALLLLVLIMLLLLLLVVVKKKRENNQNFNVEQIVKKLEKKAIPKDELKILIKKANILYKSGKKEEALKLLEQIATYSESLSYYNLGVIKLQEKNYKEALKYFQKAIENKDSRTLSAIDAAYAALMLNNKSLFKYYTNLAYLYLPELAKNRNYPYYYAIVMYYKGYEYETIPALKIKTDYNPNKLLSAVYEYLKDPAHAQQYETNPLYKGLELAQIGEYALAKNYLKETTNPIGKFALALVDLKLGEYKSAAIILKQFKNNNIYPIYIYLKPSLFNVKTAQKEFKNTFLTNKKDFYDLFFYYAPYKVLNMNKTIEYLQKGIAGIPLGAIQEAQTSLKNSAFLSNLNLKIAKAIRLALNGHIFLANKAFKKLYKKRKDSYIINYNLALTFAQLGDYKKAYFHFLKAYHLNPYDLESGVFALFAADKLNIKNPYLLASIKDSLTNKTFLIQAMLAIYNNDTVTMAAFSEKPEKNKPLWILSDLTIKAIFNKDYTTEALKLNSIFENDLISKLLYFYAKNKNLPINKLAAKFQGFYYSLLPYLNDFYYGGKLPRDWFFDFVKISGLMPRVRMLLIKKAQMENFDIIPVLKKLAFADFYTKHFEESYVIYNDLINNKNITDPHTLYYAGVAAIGAGHHNNAIALMELAKLKDPIYPEPRYALGLLWQEANNLNAASIQYAKIPNGFHSKFFDFNIKQINE